MAVICIAREMAALGEETVRELSKTTGYRPIDKEFLENRMTELGMKPETRVKYDEKKPGFWASLSQDRDDYLHFLASVLYEEIAKGDCIITGRGGFALLDGVPGVITLKLVAPMKTRIARIREQFSCDERHAIQLIKQSDHDRKGFHDYFFNVNWCDPSNYHLIINTGKQDPKSISELVQKLCLLTITDEVEKAHKERIGQLVLARKVLTEILYKQRLPLHFLEADVVDGVVTLHGVANTQAAIEAASSAAAAVPGISKVVNSIQIVQEFAVMP